jgi:signal transduction histidine kinase
MNWHGALLPSWCARLAVRFGIVLLFNFFCAVVVTWVIRMGGTFAENLVFSLCIGTLAWLLIDSTRQILWGDRKPNGIALTAIVLIALPVAQVLGSLLASTLLGIPQETVLQNKAHHALEVLLFSVLAGLTATWFFWTRGKMAYLIAAAEAEKARAAAVDRQAMQAQLQLLQAQIEPHMLFNTLANLQGLITLDPPRAQLLLEQLIEYLRATLSSSRAEVTTLAREFALMDAYFGLMAVRMGKRLSWTLDLPPSLANAMIAPMLLQPLVENAIRHGLEPKVEGGHVEVKAQAGDGKLVISVSDTGLGLDAGSQAGTRLGLANVRERLLALYGNGAALTLEPRVEPERESQLDSQLEPQRDLQLNFQLNSQPAPRPPAGAVAQLTIPYQP